MVNHAADYDVIVIGGGVVGLACLAALSKSSLRVLLVEQEPRLGTATSSRNSGVIHAGLYYPPGSLKAELCVRGRALLYERCARHGIAHRKLGKLVVATDMQQVAPLEALLERARENGVTGVSLADSAAIRAREPNVVGVLALVSRETGIVDVHGLMTSYRREATEHGADIALASAATEVGSEGSVMAVHVRGANDDAMRVTARVVVNAAGLQADKVAAMAGLPVDILGYRIQPCKGDYFALSSRLRGCVSQLIYPMPGQAGLGVHLTLDLGGQLRAGPDASYVAGLDYTVDAGKRTAFAAAVRSYLPLLRDEDLTPDFAGMRPKLQGPGDDFRDFVITTGASSGQPNLVNLVGIESPGLTASPAIAERVLALVAEVLG